ncbi:zinc finger protein 578-like isoform X1 [Osmia bicornis bicornis]|uniref:zinc finger protein 578-like isoform X1 n=2 Tax=Osmia bicornis bicornis TaxID=1437191 RepID=UPI001EAF04F5|nr:zinc finger protein 578-like isoform X1 [Osmia bicornis bicornis]
MNEKCPSCRRILNTSCSRLVKDNCGHTKCRMCLLYEEQGCRVCNDVQCIENIGNYDYPPSTKEILNDISNSEKSNICNEEVVPLELVINKDSKFKLNNFELTDNYELYCEDIFNKTRETYQSSTTDTKDDDVSNKLYVSKVESDSVLSSTQSHLNSSAVIQSCNEDNKTESLKNEKLMKNKSTKCLDHSHIVLIPGTPEKYKCNICNKIFRNKKGKCYHDACVTGVKPYQCTYCDRTFIKRSHFEYHERVHRGYKPYKCNLCEKAFPQQNKLNRHMYSHSREKQFECTKCNKKYSKRDDLKNHLVVHNSTATYSCKTCEKTFRMLTNLKRHLKTHTNERPHTCDQCNKSFKDKSLLVRHKKTHGKDRPFSCAHCNRVFLSKSELKRHLTVHSDEKPFSCKYCQTVFRRKDNLHRHIRHHHSENPPLDVNNTQNTISETNIKSPKSKQKPKKIQRITSNSIQKTPTKISMVGVNSRDQINSRLDSMGNITPVIRTTNEVSNAVSVINGPISIKKPGDKTDTRKKTFTYTEPIPLAEAVVINKRIEEKLYPQNVSNHNYFFRNCINCTDKSYPVLVKQVSCTYSNTKSSLNKIAHHENSSLETDSNVQTNLIHQNVEKQIYNKKDIKLKIKDNSNHSIPNSTGKFTIQTVNVS